MESISEKKVRPRAYPLAEFAVNCRLADIPEEIQKKATWYIADTIGCMLLGASADSSAVLRHYASIEGAGGSCTIYGSHQRTTPTIAALVNGVAAHAFDMDDVGTGGHASTVVVSALLAAAEECDASGEMLLESYCVGMEVCGAVYKVLMSDHGAHYARGWHTTSTSGAIGAAAGCAHLYGLNFDQTLNAICNAADLSFGLKKSFGSMTKHINAGYAAQAGLASAKLARVGFESNPWMLDGPAGYFECFCDKYDPSALSQIGIVWTMETSRIQKLYSCCGFAHRGICAVLDNLEHIPEDFATIKKIVVELPDAESEPLQYHLPQTGTEASFSAEYTIAAAIIDRKLTLKSFTDTMVLRPEIQQLMKKIELRTFPAPAYTGIERITISTAGSEIVCTCVHAAGSAKLPLTEEQLRVKFLDCAASGIERGVCEQTLEQLLALKSMERIKPLIDGITAAALF